MAYAIGNRTLARVGYQRTRQAASDWETQRARKRTADSWLKPALPTLPRVRMGCSSSMSVIRRIRGWLSRHDTIEFATGICKSGDVLFVACRSFGVELIDVSDPTSPRHLSTVRTGEAQSVVERNGYLYAGVWASSEVVTVDVRNPWTPRITSRTPLDGYGDGVDVRGNYLYAATGHHSRQPAANQAWRPWIRAWTWIGGAGHRGSLLTKVGYAREVPRRRTTSAMTCGA